MNAAEFIATSRKINALWWRLLADHHRMTVRQFAGAFQALCNADEALMVEADTVQDLDCDYQQVMQLMAEIEHLQRARDAVTRDLMFKAKYREN